MSDILEFALGVFGVVLGAGVAFIVVIELARIVFNF